MNAWAREARQGHCNGWPHPGETGSIDAQKLTIQTFYSAACHAFSQILDECGL